MMSKMQQVNWITAVAIILAVCLPIEPNENFDDPNACFQGFFGNYSFKICLDFDQEDICHTKYFCIKMPLKSEHLQNKIFENNTTCLKEFLGGRVVNACLSSNKKNIPSTNKDHFVSIFWEGIYFQRKFLYETSVCLQGFYDEYAFAMYLDLNREDIREKSYDCIKSSWDNKILPNEISANKSSWNKKILPNEISANKSSWDNKILPNEISANKSSMCFQGFLGGYAFNAFLGLSPEDICQKNQSCTEFPWIVKTNMTASKFPMLDKYGVFIPYVFLFIMMMYLFWCVLHCFSGVTWKKKSIQEFKITNPLQIFERYSSYSGMKNPFIPVNEIYHSDLSDEHQV